MEILGPLPDAILGGFAFGALSHVLLDLCTNKGVPLLPFGGFPFSLRICATGSFGEYALLGMGIILFWICQGQKLFFPPLSLY